MGCGCGGKRSTAQGSVGKFEVVVSNTGGKRTTKYLTATEARAAARSSGGTAYRVTSTGRTPL